MEEFSVGLASQPNVGKSTLFNLLTKSRVYVANWPGKTVEKTEGIFEFEGRKIRLIDLPGIRSLNAISEEEKIAKEFIISQQYDALIVLADAETLIKSFYFVAQILELTDKVVVAINKYDEANKLGLHLNIQAIQSKINVPVVPISALKNLHINELLLNVIDVASKKETKAAIKINYGSIESYIQELSKKLNKIGIKENGSRFFAIRILEGDTTILQKMNVGKKEREKILKEVKKIESLVKKKEGITCKEKIVMQRYKFVNEILNKNLVYVKVAKKEFSDYIDALILKKFFFGLATSLFFLFLIIFLSFSINTGFPLNIILKSLGNEKLAESVEEYSLSNLINMLFLFIGKTLENLIVGWPEFVKDLIENGILAGVAAVLSFFPLIFVVNLFMAIAEDSGIISRVAVVFHRLTSKFNLSGKVVFPTTISLACNVPGILSSRIIENEKERKSIATTIPFIICQARLIVLLFLVSIFFSSALEKALIITFIYFLSFVIFIISYIGVSKFVLKLKEKVELFIELPSYHFPSLRVVWWISWERSKSFITKAGSIILPMAILVWFILHFGPNGYTTKVEFSFGKQIGEEIAKIFPFNLPWQLSFSLVSGFIAKELIIETLAISFSIPQVTQNIAQLGISKPSALAFITFAMLYTPCLASVTATYLETKSKKLTLLSVILSIVLAYFASLFVYFIFNFILK
ncbi:MAG: ferrous iron transport protein B [Candidatus Micrarchaeia archaeon]